MKYFFSAVLMLCTALTHAQYSFNFESWPIIAEGSWSRSGPGGTYRGSGIYVNFGNEASGLRKVGFNSSGDRLEIPAVTNPNVVSFKARLSSDAAASFIAVQYYTGSWRSAETFRISSTSYRTFRARVNYEGEDVRLRIRMNSYGRSVFLDDLRVTTFVPPVLPVELAAFEARHEPGRGVRLQWRTVTETDNERFDLQRSREGITFETVASLPGAGNSITPREYDYLDPRPYPGLSYYRLRQVDHDGGGAYSKVVSVIAPEQPAALRVTPTLVREELRIRLPPTPRERTLQVIGMDGEIVMTRQLGAGASEVNLEMENLQKGVYILRVDSMVKRFVKL